MSQISSSLPRVNRIRRKRREEKQGGPDEGKVPGLSLSELGKRVKEGGTEVQGQEETKWSSNASFCCGRWIFVWRPSGRRDSRPSTITAVIIRLNNTAKHGRTFRGMVSKTRTVEDILLFNRVGLFYWWLDI